MRFRCSAKDMQLSLPRAIMAIGVHIQKLTSAPRFCATASTKASCTQSAVKRTLKQHPKADINPPWSARKWPIADQVCLSGHRINNLDVDLLGDLDRVIDLNADIPDSAFNLRVPEQQLDRA